MNFSDLITLLRANNISISAGEGKLRVNAKAGVVTSEIKAALLLHKEQLLAVLSKDPESLNHASVSAPQILRITPSMLPLIHLDQEEIDHIVAIMPGGAANIQDIYPLAPLQDGILFHHLLEKHGDPYLTRTMLAFDHREHLDKFIRAMQAVIDRHDILRTAFCWIGLSRPAQVVLRHASLPVHNHNPGAGVDPEHFLHDLTSPHKAKLDITCAPLLAVHLAFDTQRNEWILALLFHHLAIDHVTLDKMLGEVALLIRDPHCRLPTALPYRDHIAQLLSIPASVHEDFFREQLSDIDAPTAPYDILNVLGDGSTIVETSMPLDSATSRSLREVARHRAISPSVLFHVAWALVLSLCTGRRDIVFGTVLSGRLQGTAGVSEMLGLFVNALPVRISLDALSTLEVVMKTRNSLVQLIDHEQASLVMAQRCSEVRPPMPLFTTLLNYRHNASIEPSMIDSWEGIRNLSSEERSNYPLCLSVDDFGDDFSFTVQSVAPISSERVAIYMQMAVTSLVEGLMRLPNHPVCELAVLPQREREQLLHDFNDTATDFPAASLIHQRFEQQAAGQPDAVAVVFETQTITYGELDARANQVAHHLIALGVQPDDRVAICAGRNPDMVVGLLGILKAGAGYVPLDPDYPAERLAYMLEDSAPVALLTVEAHRDLLSYVTCPVVLLDDASLAGLPRVAPRVPDLRSTHLAYVIYTSGSSGRPKGVLVEHAGLCNLAAAQAAAFAVTPESRVLQFASFSFDASVWECFMALANGAALCLAPRDALMPGPTLQSTMLELRITHATLPSSAAQLMDPATLPGSMHLIVAGEACPPQVAQRMAAQVAFFNAYGPTETTVCATLYRCGSDIATSVPIGRPIANTSIYILDAYGAPVPIGVSGEIFIGGAGIARGYLNRPDLTAGNFLSDPFSTRANARMYKTGDLGRWLPDGNIEYLGRNDFQVKIRGFRIELGEIEARLAACEGIREAIVIAREDIPGDKRLVAYFVAGEGIDPAAAGLRAKLAADLPDYMLPSAFVRLDAVPLTTNGKVDRKALPVPGQSALISRAFEAPIGDIETRIAEIWQTLLNVERVGRHDNFFELGGHSLLAVQLTARIAAALGADLPLRDLFANPVLCDLAQLLASAAPTTFAPITLADRSQPLPLSWAQQRLWFIDQLDHTAGAAYCMPAAFRLSGQLQRSALGATLDAIVARHEALRTTFVTLDGQPVQRIAPADIGCPLPLTDLRHLPHEQRLPEALRIAAAEFAAPFDLASGPLFRCRLVCLDDDDHALLINQHHIVSDGWSIGVLMREFSTLYTAIAQGQAALLPPLAIQYADYAVWQRNWLQGQALQQQVDFWRDHLAGAPALLELPTDRPRPHVQSHRGQNFTFMFDPDLSEAVRRFSRRHDSTLYMTLLAAFSALLSRLSGQSDVVIGTPVANRRRAELEPLIGFFVNTLALRVQLDDGLTVAGLLKRVRSDTLAAYAHQDIPFEQVVEAVQPSRSLSHAPLFQVMLVLNNTPSGGENGLPDLSLSGLELPQEAAHFDLTLLVTDAGESLVGSFNYAVDLFDAATIERMSERLRLLLAAMVADDTCAVARLPVLSAAEKQQVVADFNDTAADYPADALIHQLFEQQAAHKPDAVAVVFEDQSLSYAGLNARANRLAHRLIALGVQPDDRVALCVERGTDMVAGMLAILKAGAGYVPLDPDYPAERLAYMLADATPAALLTQSHLAARLPRHDLPMLQLDDAAAMAEIARQADTNPLIAGLNSSNLAYVIYTSGSTGKPKGVMVEHRSFHNFLSAMAFEFGVDEHSVSMAIASVAFDITGMDIHLPLVHGATIALLDRSHALDAEKLIAAIKRHHGTWLQATPTTWQALRAHGWIGEPGFKAICGGEPCPPELARELANHHPFFNAYGPTETAVCAVMHRCGSEMSTSVPIGRPIANTRIYILDANGAPVPVGVSGEIFIGGAGVARGYLNRPDLTAERFLADPFSTRPDARMYKTGDLARWLPDGNIEYLGRNDFQVKIRGFRIELGEIEARLAACAGVRETVVIAREDIPGDKRLVAYFVAPDGAGVTAANLRAQLADELPDYMLPSAFVQLDALPLTPNGKLDRKALPEPGQDALISRAYEAPVGPVEMIIAGIWQELLHVERVGRNDNFFELGGHSLLTVKLIERLRVQDIHIAVRAIFDFPTVASLAASILSAPVQLKTVEIPPNMIPHGCSAITPSMLPLVTLSQGEIGHIAATVAGGIPNIQDIYPLAPLQEGILFHHLLEQHGDAYLTRFMMAVDSRARLDAFLSALERVINRHDTLRTAFCWANLSQAVQVVLRHVELPVHIHTAPDGADALEYLLGLTDPRHIRLQPTSAPLIATHVVFNPDSGEWLLALLNHHLVADHITLERMLGEIMLLMNDPAHVLPPTLPYRNFIAQVLSVPVSVHEAYFREQLGDIDSPTAPFGVLDVLGDGNLVVDARIALDSALASQLRLAARRLAVSPSVLFHLAWAHVLSLCTGQHDVVFGTVVAGRLQGSVGADQVLGLFINALPLRVSLAGHTVLDAVAEARRRLADLLEHEQTPLALAQRCSAVPPPLPLFTSLLNYRHSAVGDDDAEQGWAGIRMLSGEERTNYPLTLSVDDMGQDFAISVQAVAPINADRVVAYMAAAITGLVEALAHAPATPIQSVPILPLHERDQLIHGFNDTAVDYPAHALIHQLFEQQAARQPDAVAVVFEDQPLSYAALNARANQLAHRLIAMGVQPDNRVALCVERSADMVVGLLAILKAGAGYVPLDPNYPAERLAWMLADAAPAALLTQSHLSTKLPAHPLPTLQLDDAAAMAEIAQQLDTAPVVPGLSSGNLASVIYTSGSTGEPKGVMVEHRNVLRLVIGSTFAPVTPDDCMAQVANVAFDASTWEIWSTLLNGARLLIVPHATVLNPPLFGDTLLKHGATLLLLTAGLFNQYASVLGAALGKLRHLLVGGDVLHPVAIRRLLESGHAPARLINAYGPTEATVIATTYVISSVAEGAVSIPIGRPIANTSIYILDAHGAPVPIGVPGEIFIGGAGVARGYLNRPDQTAQRFLADPFSSQPDARMYKTGDLGCWLPDGNIEYIGRNDFQVKIRGFRIELGEIETRLAACAGIRETIVIAREDVPGDKRLVAYFVASEGAEPAAAGLRAQLAADLPDYMLPSAFVQLDVLPLTANGKVDRKALPAPGLDALISRAFEAPVGDIETAIAEIWQELLHVERVGRQDNFFELGGHSLLAVQLTARIATSLGADLPLRDLFAHPVLCELAKLLASAAPTTFAPITVADRSRPLPLSWAQQRLWFIDQLDHGAGAAYYIPNALRLSGQLNRSALGAALDTIVARHEALRTTFVTVDGQAVQCIAPENTGCPLPLTDLRHLPHEERLPETLRIAAEEFAAPFDLATGPLFRCRLVCLDDDDHALLINQHHIVSDGWSVGVLIREFSTLYAAIAQGQPAALPPLPIQYADYAAWQRTWLQGHTLQQQVDFWRDHLAGAPALLELPTDRPRPHLQSHRGDHRSFILDDELSNAVRRFSRRHDTTLFMTLLAAFSTLLSRLSGQSDVVIGTPVANRRRAELEPLIGFFVNTLALRVQFDEALTVAGLLTRVRHDTLAAWAHQDIPFEQIVETVQPPRSLSHSPLFQVMLVLNNTPSGGELNLPNLSLSGLELAQDAAHFDLTLSITEAGDLLAGTINYAIDLFDAATIERMIGCFQRLLAAMVSDDTCTIARLPLLSDTERQQVVAGFNDTSVDYPAHALIHQIFEQQAAQRPEAVAVVFENQSFSYGEINARANQLAHRLIAMGVQPDDRVALCIERSPDMVAGLLAILKAGAGYVPLDPDYPAERLAYMLADAAPTALLTQTHLATKLPPHALPTLQLDDATAIEAIAQEPNTNPLVAGLSSRNLAYVIYTSGSTGEPKGVMVEHRNVLRLVIGSTFAPITHDDCVAQCANVAFDASTWEIWAPLLNGARLLIVPQATVLNPPLFGDTLVKHSATSLWLTVGLFNQYAGLLGHAFATLRHLLVGGDVLDPAIIRRLIENGHAPAHLVNGYGPTESTTFAATYAIASVASNAVSIPIGRPIANTSIYILDAHGAPVPVGVTGEIFIGGDGVARGYLNRPDLTAQRFVADPFSSQLEARMYKTGDLGRWLPDGNIEYLGRNDFQIKIRGFRIELGEIEARIAACAGVRETVVIAREDIPGDKRLVAYVVASEGAEPAAADLRAQLAADLPDYMLPAAFVQLEALPLTPNGKLDRKALPAPGLDALISREFEAPVGEIEITIAEIWQELLRIDRVGRHDNFFELGGHSLLIVTLIEHLRVQDMLITVRSVFDCPTVASLAASIGSAQVVKAIEVPPNAIPDGCTTITPSMLPLVTLSQGEIGHIGAMVPGGMANIQDIYPLAPLQEGILFHHLLERQGDAYLTRFMMVFDSRERLDTFVTAMQQVINRHDILRTSFCWDDLSQPVQVVLRQATLALHTHVLTGDVSAQLDELTNPHHHRIDLTQAPLMVAHTAFDAQANEWRFALLNHHLVIDHVTLDKVFGEVSLILQQQPDRLPVALPYRNFIAQVLSVPVSVHEAYFREQLGDIDSPTAPFGVLDVLGDGSSVAMAHVALDPALARLLRTTSRRLAVSPSALFHLAWAQVLSLCTGNDDVVFGTVLAGRLQGSAGADQVLGLFINALPIRISLGGHNVLDAVAETRRRLTDLLEHEQTPLALAQRCSAIPAALPLFTTLLNYRHSAVAESDGEGDDGWAGIRFLSGEERTNYPVTLSVDDLGQDFAVSVQAVASINADRVAAYMAAAVAGLVDALTQAPATLIQSVPVLPLHERDQLIHGFNGTAVDYPAKALIHQLFEQQAARQPETLAITFEGQSFSYGWLNARANQLAHRLITMGVQPDDRVAICVERSADMVAGLLAILKAGAGYVPLDPDYPVERLAYMLADAAPTALLTQTHLATKLPPHALPTLQLDDAVAMEAIAQEPNTNPVVAGLSSRNLAYVIYTSGSTGEPKGVMVEHRNVLRLVIGSTFAPITPNDCVAQCANVAFDASTWEIWAPLLNGARLLIVPQATVLNPPLFGDTLVKQGATSLWLTVGLFNQYAGLLGHAFATLRHLLVGGDVLDPAIIRRLIENGHAPAHLVNGYGPTESTTFAATYAIASVASNAMSIPIGRPIANTSIYILNAHGAPVPVGVAGEIFIGGDGVARGYLNRPDLTAQRFVADPFSSQLEARMYKTGDLGRWLADGNVEYLGRNDFQVKIRGFRIELGEIEARIAACAGVRETVVIAREDSPGDKRLVAYFVASEGTEPAAADLRAQLAADLPEYMLPSAFMQLDALPLTPNGKLDRKALPVPGQDALITRAFEAPVGDIETAIAEIWQELLHVERVGRHDNFFELGGHSLLAVQLTARIATSLGADLPLRDLFAHPVLCELANLLASAAPTTFAPITLADRSQPLPLSWAQQRLWFIDQLDHAAGAAYCMPAALRLSGQLNRSALGATLDAIVARHEALRTTFVTVDGQPVQCIAPEDSGCPLLLTDLRHLPHEQRLPETLRIAAEEFAAPFDLATGPLFRCRLVCLDEDDHALLINQHHIVSDGWSIGVLIREFSALYAAIAQGQPAALPALPIQYADYAAWQRTWLQGQTLQQQVDFWHDHLAGAPAMLELPTDRPRPHLQSHRGDHLSFLLDAELSNAVRRFSRRHDATLFMTLLAAFSTLLSRLSGQADVVIGTPVANRRRAELEPLIGFFVNTLALRVQFDEALTVAGLLTRVRHDTLAAYAHQDIPFEQIVEAVQPPRSLGHAPLFQVMLVLNNTPSGGEFSLPNLSLSGLELPQDSAHFDLTLSITEAGDSLAGSVNYATDLFDAATIEGMMERFRLLLAAMVADDTCAVASLPLLSEAERQQVVAGFNDTAVDFPAKALIHQIFEQQAASRPEAVAVVFEDQSFSYGEINARANQLAHRLIAMGVQPDDRVALCVERSPDMVAGLLAILKAGAGYVPLDPDYPAERLAYMLADAAPTALLTQTHLATKLPPHALPTLQLDDAVAMEAIAQEPNTNLVVAGLSSRNLAYVIYTSGSTGEPKGVMVEHRNVLRLVIGSTFAPMTTEDCVAQCANVAFDASTWEIWAPLLNGARLLIVPQATVLNPPLFGETLLRHGTTSLWLTVGLFNQYAGLLGHAFATLRHLLVGGDVLDPAIIRRLIENGHAPASLVNGYGPTESTTFAATYAIASVNKDSVSIPIGRPIANTSIYILDAHGAPVPVGVTGEIFIGGDGVARGYLNRPDITAQRFVADPFSSQLEARMYKTGDLGRWLPDGNVEYLGRNDFQVKIRGFRIELGEIEARIAACAGVRETVVIAREDIPGDKRLVAYFVASEGAEPAAADLRAQLAADLPDYMLPAAFVQLEALPLTPNGKLDRKALPVPGQDALISRAYEAPVGEVEITIAGIWQELLQVERIGRHDNFFELGGHSLLIVTLIEHLRLQDMSITVRSVFDFPTVATLAASIASASDINTIEVPPNAIPDGCTAITPAMLPLVTLSQSEIDHIAATVPGGMANIQDIYPLAPLQEGILYHHLLEHQGDTYISRFIMAFDTRERLDTFLFALQRVIDRHDILRTAFCWNQVSQPVQIVLRSAQIHVQTHTFEADAYEQLHSSTNPTRLRIDLTQAPVIATHIAFDSESGEWLLAMLNHHLVVDHVTLERMLAEVSMLLLDPHLSLPPSLPYRNFVAQVQSVPVSAHEAYFRNRLGDIDSPTAPYGLLDLLGDGSSVDEKRIALDPALARKLREAARRLAVTPSVLFHVAWARVLSMCASRDDVVFGTVLSGRSQGSAGADQVLGLFLNALPVRIQLAGRTALQSVTETWRQLADLIEHEQTPLALAQRCSSVPAPMPLYSALLNFRHSPMPTGGETDAAYSGIRQLLGEERSNYPLCLSVDDIGEDFLMTVHAIPGIPLESILSYMNSAVAGLAGELAQPTGQPLCKIPVLPANEREQVLFGFNDTAVVYPANELIHQRFEQLAAQQPEAIAVVFAEQSLSYGELNARANRLAHCLIALGVQPDDRVAICVGRGPDMVAGLLAILKAGAGYVPLDPNYPAGRLAFMLSDAAPAALLTQSHLSATLPAHHVPTLRLDDEAAIEQIAQQSGANPLVPGLGPQHLAYVIYTSGSTGQPKGVMVEHHGLCNLALAQSRAFGIDAGSRVLQYASISFDASVAEIVTALSQGAMLCLVSSQTVYPGQPLLATFSRYQITHATLPPSVLQLLPAEQIPPALTLIVAGEPCPPALAQNLADRHAFFNAYGPTEATVCATIHRCTSAIAAHVPIGRPIANTRIYILDAHGEPVPIGVSGEIFIGGAGVARGYLNRPDLTAERFLADPFSQQPDARMVKTGDLARWLPDGNIEYLGRNDDQIKIRGFRIEPGEIEARLAACEGVREAVVIAREDGTGDKRLLACFVASDGATPAPAGLRAQLAAHLPDYMLPSAFVQLDNLPLTANGKLDRNALPLPGPDALISRVYEAPVGDIESRIAEIWQDLLQVGRVGRLDNFFELGGNSLMAIRFIAKIEMATGETCAIRSVLEHPTLAELAKIVRS